MVTVCKADASSEVSSARATKAALAQSSVATGVATDRLISMNCTGRRLSRMRRIPDMINLKNII
jgi:hypothetical protein